MPSSSLIPAAREPRLELPQVTLCAISSSNLAATVAALRTSMSQVDFASVLLFSHASALDLELTPDSGIQLVRIEQIASSAAYSYFVLERLARYITTSHCLVAQWDGHVIDARKWRPEFLEYDYIGASWPQFADDHDVGNGGFSLRSKRLLEACRKPEFERHHPEDVAICRTNRDRLEAQGMRFAPAELADAFSAERGSDPAFTFGYHGAFLMPRVLGSDRFWELYRGLNERASLWADTWKVARDMRSPSRIARLLRDRRADMLARRARR